MLRGKEEKPIARSGHMELPVRTSLLRLSDSKEESILLLELFGSGKNHSGVDLPLEEGGGAEDVQVATWLHA